MAGTERWRLTNARIARLRPREREFTVWDTLVAGLGVRVRPSGGASFVFVHKAAGRSRRVSLGSIALKDLEDCRRRCHELMANAELGGSIEVRRHAPLFRDFAAGPWTETHFSRFKPSTRVGAKSSLDNHLVPAFGSTPLDRIGRNQVLRWFDACSESRPGAANFALRILHQILNFAIACGHIDANPSRGIKQNRRAALMRFLSRDEIGRLHRVLDAQAQKGPRAQQQADIIRLLLLTGCRKGEILRLRWSEVDGGTLALADSKTGPRKVPLNAPARRIIDRQIQKESNFVFPSPGNVHRPLGPGLPLWTSVRRAAGIEDVRLHDLRHTFASHAVMTGVPVPVVSRLLGHRSTKMTLRYAHLADKEVEAAAERIGAAMARVLTIGKCTSDS